MRILRKVLSVLITISMVLVVLLGVSEPIKVQAASVITIDLTKISNGSAGEGWEAGSSSITINKSGNYKITTGGILVDRAIQILGTSTDKIDVNLTIENLALDTSSSCIWLQYSNCNINIVRNNSLNSRGSNGIRIGNSEVIFDGTGKLNILAEQSGIYQMTGSPIVFNGGTISTRSINRCGIGSYKETLCNIIFNGGNITVTGGDGEPGIGVYNSTPSYTGYYVDWIEKIEFNGGNIDINGNGGAIGGRFAGVRDISFNGANVTFSTAIYGREEMYNISITGGELTCNSAYNCFSGLEYGLNISGGIINCKGFLICPSSSARDNLGTISGGTITANSLLSSSTSKGNVNIIGGSINLADNAKEPINTFGEKLSVYELDGFDPNAPINSDCISGMEDYDYYLNDVYADNEGKIYVYLPESIPDSFAKVNFYVDDSIVAKQLVIKGKTVYSVDADFGTREFLGWYIDKQFNIEFELGTSTVNTDMNIYARFTDSVIVEEHQHTYDNACAAECNVCHEKRTPAAHVYDNACDATCNECNALRTPLAHVYDNDCDTVCNICNEVRVAKAHVYDNGCDRTCNVCGAQRTTSHVYDNACDADCNECGAKRLPSAHVYDNDSDNICNVCGASRGGSNSGTVTPTNTPTSTTTPTPTGGSSNSSTTPTSVPTQTPVSTPIPTTSPTNQPTSAPTSTPTVGPIPTSAPTTAPEQSVGSFVDRCYEVALGREADEAGFEYWLNALNEGKICGAQAGYGFIFSGEYINKNRTNEEFVTDLYTMYFGRTPDSEGFNYWVGLLNDGKDREEIFAGFANSLEFDNLCAKYGVVTGAYIVGVPNDQQGGVNSFVARLYQVCLNRLPDMGGQSGWVQKLIAGEVTGTTCAYGFVFSPEFIGKEPSNEEFVAYMYRAFFGREADEGGFTAWVSTLNNGGSYEDVFNGFTGSAEFFNLCASYGINP